MAKLPNEKMDNSFFCVNCLFLWRFLRDGCAQAQSIVSTSCAGVDS
jgi:hypothetical protein